MDDRINNPRTQEFKVFLENLMRDIIGDIMSMPVTTLVDYYTFLFSRRELTSETKTEQNIFTEFVKQKAPQQAFETAKNTFNSNFNKCYGLLEQEFSGILEGTRNTKRADLYSHLLKIFKEKDKLDQEEPTHPVITTSPVQINWQKICTDILIQAQKDRLTTSPLAPQPMTLEGMHVPLGLVKREKPEPNRPKRDIEPEQGSELYREREDQERVIPVEYDEFMKAVLKAEKPTAVIGEPGAGKTTLLQKIAFAMLEANKDALVIWVDLAALENHTLKSYIENVWLGNAAEAAQTDIDTIKEDFKRQRQARNVWLILDGVDEMDAGSPLSKIASDLREMWCSKVVLTCRLNVWDGDKNALNDFQVYRNLDFEPDQVNDFINRWFGSIQKTSDGESLIQALQVTGKERIRNLVRNPLRLTLLCISWHNGGRNLPETKAGFYEYLVDALYSWKDSSTSEKFNILPEDKIALHKALGELAKAGIEADTSRYRMRKSVVEKYLGKLSNVARNLGWLNRIGRAELDESNPDEAVFAFFHTTFQEYFAATAIEDWDFFLPRNHNGKPVENHPYRIFDKRWKEVVLFWLGQSDIDEEQKKEFLGVGAPTGLAQFIESAGGTGDDCYNFYGWEAEFWMILATSEVYHLQNFTEWAEGRIAKAIKLAFGEFKDQHWQTYLKPIAKNAEKILPQLNPRSVAKYICELLEIINESIDSKIRIAAVQSIGKITIDEASRSLAIPVLIQILQDESINFALLIHEVDEASSRQIIDARWQNIQVEQCHQTLRITAAQSLGKIAIDEASRSLAIPVLIQILQDESIDLRIAAVQSIGEIAIDEASRSLAIPVLTQILQGESINLYSRIIVAESIGKIAIDEVSRSLAINALIEILEHIPFFEHSPYLWLRKAAAESLRKIAIDEVSRSLAINALIEILESSSYSLPRKTLALISRISRTYENLTLSHWRTVIISQRGLIQKKCDGVLYGVLWNYAQNISYQDFYAAWHDQPTISHPEGLDTNQVGSSAETNTLDRQVINLSTIQKDLLLTHAESTTLPILIDCSSLLSITDEDTLAARLSNRIFEALSLELPEVDKVAQLERQLSKLRASTQKNIVLILYSQETLQKIQTLLSTIKYDWLNVLHTFATTKEEIQNQIKDWI